MARPRTICKSAMCDGEATGAGLKRNAHGPLLLDDSCGMLLHLLLGPSSRSAGWPRVGKCARIELVIYPVPTDELWGVLCALCRFVLFRLFPLTVSMCEDALKFPTNSIVSPHWHSIMNLLSSHHREWFVSGTDAHAVLYCHGMNWCTLQVCRLRWTCRDGWLKLSRDPPADRLQTTAAVSVLLSGPGRRVSCPR